MRVSTALCADGRPHGGADHGKLPEVDGISDHRRKVYKYPYNEQLMIFAQRPEATACAEYDLWNKQMRRYVRRGSKGIALVDTSSDQPKLRYVFDVSDTSGARTLAALIFGNTGKSIVRWYLRRWNSALTFPVKTDLPIRWSVWRRSL